jgi:hypothetical protein
MWSEWNSAVKNYAGRRVTWQRHSFMVKKGDGRLSIVALFRMLLHLVKH